MNYEDSLKLEKQGLSIMTGDLVHHSHKFDTSKHYYSPHVWNLPG